MTVFIHKLLIFRYHDLGHLAFIYIRRVEKTREFFRDGTIWEYM